jgi:hypothetical protein
MRATPAMRDLPFVEPFRGLVSGSNNRLYSGYTILGNFAQSGRNQTALRPVETSPSPSS